MSKIVGQLEEFEIYEHQIPHYSYYDCIECSKDPSTDPRFTIRTKSEAIEHVKKTEHDVMYQVGFGKVFTLSEHIDNE